MWTYKFILFFLIWVNFTKMFILKNSFHLAWGI